MNGVDNATLNVLKLFHNEKGRQYRPSCVDSRYSIHHNQRFNTSIETRCLHKDSLPHKQFALNFEQPTEQLSSNLNHTRSCRVNFVRKSNHAMNGVKSGVTNKKKRRLSNLGCLTASFFEDYAKAARRESMASMTSMTDLHWGSDKCDSGDDDSVISNMSDGFTTENMNPLILQSSTRQCVSEFHLREAMQTFYEVMTMSQKSQLAIHDWDKKMGLKRSHSKTMRLTMRSRKKLKTMVKKDMLLLRKI
jgi:hypothetical protein